MKKLLLILMVVVLTLGSSAYAWHLWREHEAKQVSYTTEQLQRGTLDEVVSAAGRVLPREVYVVGSELAGKVTAVLADYNQTVSEGDVLLRLDDRMARARLAEAEVIVQLAQSAVRQATIQRDTQGKLLDRLRKMAEEVRNPEDVDIAEGKWRAAEVAVEEARIRVRQAEDARRKAELGLRLTIVRAPVFESTTSSASLPHRPGTGVVVEDSEPSRLRRCFVVLERSISVNQEIGPSNQGRLFTLASDLQHMRVTAEVGEGDIDKIRRGMTARFTVGNAGDEAAKYYGSIEDVHLVPSSEHGAIYYKVEIDSRNERDSASGDWKLRPGLSASVDIIRRSHRDVWKVPSAALNFEPSANEQSSAARKKLVQRDSLLHPEEWQTVWSLGADGRPWPLFVRTGGKDARGETGITADRYTEVLQWDEEVRDPATLRVITAAPPPKQSIFSIPKIQF